MPILLHSCSLSWLCGRKKHIREAFCTFLLQLLYNLFSCVNSDEWWSSKSGCRKIQGFDLELGKEGKGREEYGKLINKFPSSWIFKILQSRPNLEELGNFEMFIKINKEGFLEFYLIIPHIRKILNGLVPLFIMFL